MPGDGWRANVISMESAIFLDTFDKERLLRVMESSVAVRHRHQLFMWARSSFYALLPHEILVCLRLRRGIGATHVECLHNLLFSDEEECRMCHPQDGLAVRLALACEASGNLPALIGNCKAGANHGLGDLPVELDAAGLRNAIVHGDRVDNLDEACFYVLFNLDQEVDAVHGHLIQLMLPHLHLAFSRVNASEIKLPLQKSNGAAEAGAATRVEQRLAITKRELQILQYICRGKSNYEIGMILEISPLTVKNHVQKVFRKLNVHNRAQAVSRGAAMNILRQAD